MPTPEELEIAGSASEAICDELAGVLEGKDIAHGIAALFGVLRHVGEQTEGELRALVTRDLRELADELEAIAATKH